MFITAKELAKALGLSEAAVSLSLNNKPGVSTQTRQRVWEKAKELGYDFTRHSMRHVDLKGTICLVIYKRSGAIITDSPFFVALAEGVLAGCKRNSYDFVIKYVYEDESLSEQLYLLKNSKFTGIILLGTEMTQASLQPFTKLATPIVLLDAYFDTAPFDSVLINNAQGAFIATDYLITKRKKQPGYLQSSYPISNFTARADGFYRAVRSHGMSASLSPVHHLTPSQEGAYADMKAFIQSGMPLADCYFADNDQIAIGAIQALQEAGWRIPEDIAIVGFDNLPMCELLSPPLTTVNVPAQYMGEAATLRLTSLIESTRQLPIKMEINTTLIKRKSV